MGKIGNTIDSYDLRYRILPLDFMDSIKQALALYSRHNGRETKFLPFLRKIGFNRRVREKFVALSRYFGDKPKKNFRGRTIFVDQPEKKATPPPSLRSPLPSPPPRLASPHRGGEPSRSVRCRAISKIQARPLPQRQRFSGLLCNAVISPNCRCKKQFAIDVSED